MTTQATIAVLVVVMVVCVVLVAATVSARVARERRSRSLARLTGPHRALLLDVASGEDDDGSSAAAVTALTGKTWEGVRGVVITLLTKVRGAPADQLVAILREHGEIDLARAGTRARSVTHRARSANTLGLTRAGEALPDLVPLLGDRSPEVRLVAARALGQIADPAAASEVLQAVVPPDGRRSGPIGVPAWIVSDALLAMGPTVGPVVLAGLVDPHPQVRGVAASVAAHATYPGLRQVLRERLEVETEPLVRASVATALGRVGRRDDVEVLADHASPSTDPHLRRACVDALGALGAGEATEVLVELLGDDDRRLSTIAADALVGLGPAGREVLEAISAQGDAAARAARGSLQLADLRGAS
ncbi:MAG: HEAT repeat domain-containing protein [Mobilicoccus sp.]|nr:HEAT repeat domain-containing protein [Mobilicoccus sp.]